MLALILVGMARNLAPPDALFLGAAVVLALTGVISPEEAFSGFANPGVITLAGLFIVAAALRETGVLDAIGQRLLGAERNERGALLRLAGFVVPMSAFVNNTPIVAMLMPVILDFCRKHKISASRLLIPLSYLAILGGTCTLIGTSTNLVVHGLLLGAGSDAEQLARMPVENREAWTHALRGMGLFEIGMVGLPFALIGTLYMWSVGVKLLPHRKELIEQLGDSRREYLVEMEVQAGCRLIGQSVEKAGLRHLEGLFLIEIDRSSGSITPVGPETVILAEDRLIFTGIVETIVELEKIPGLVPAADPEYEVQPKARRDRNLCEAVISMSSPLAGQSVRKSNFRARYNSAVIAVHRNGARLRTKIGDIVLRPGDTLLLQAGPNFSRAHGNNTDFYLVSDVEGSSPLRHDRSYMAIALFVGLIIVLTTGLVTPAIGALLAAGLMVATRCISASGARRSVEWQVLVTIAAAIGVGKALDNSGIAQIVAEAIAGFSEPLGAIGPWVALAAIYLVALATTELVTNNAAAVLIFPFCLDTALMMEVSPRPFVMALALAASSSFATPIGYQTNMMVFGPGGYRFTDFMRVGLPLDLILWITAVLLVPIFWPF